MYPCLCCTCMYSTQCHRNRNLVNTVLISGNICEFKRQYGDETYLQQDLNGEYGREGIVSIAQEL